MTIKNPNFDFSSPHTNRLSQIREAARMLEAEFPDYGVASSRVKAVMDDHEKVMVFPSHNERSLLVDCMTLLAAPKNMKVEASSGEGKNAQIVKRLAAEFIDSPKHTIREVAKKIREAQATARATRMRSKSSSKIVRKPFLIELENALKDEKSRLEIFSILNVKGWGVLENQQSAQSV